MKVKMKLTVKGSPDHITVVEYQKGKVYDLPEDLADAFLKAKFAEKYEEVEEVKEVKEEVKAKEVAPKNKAIEAAPENKAKRGLRKSKGKKK